MTVITSLASTTLILTPLIIILLLLVPLLDKRYSAKWRYVLWALVMTGLILPIVNILPHPAVYINIPVGFVTLEPSQNHTVSEQWALPNVSAQSEVHVSGGAESTAVLYVESFTYIAAIPRTNNISEHISPTPPTNTRETVVRDVYDAYIQPYEPFVVPSRVFYLADILLFTWLGGMLLSFLHNASGHFAFMRSIRRWRKKENNPVFLQMLENECEYLGIVKTPRLERCKKIRVPMVAGLLKPVVLLPDEDFDSEDLPLILRHELVHFKRRDLWYKSILALVRCIHWFNPAVHLMVRQANKDIEIICDMITVRDMPTPSRIKYSEIILSMASDENFRGSQLTTNFFGGKHMLKQRFSNILGNSKKSGAALFIITGVFVVVIGLFLGVNFYSGEETNTPTMVSDYLPLSSFNQQPSNESGFVVEENRSSARPEQVQQMYIALAEQLHQAELRIISSGEPFVGGAVRVPRIYSATNMIEFLSPEVQSAFMEGQVVIDLNPLVGSIPVLGEIRRSDLAVVSSCPVSPRSRGACRCELPRIEEDLSVLRDMVLHEPRVVEHLFEYLSDIILTVEAADVNVTIGGDYPTIRFNEWVEGQFTVTRDEDFITVSSNIPLRSLPSRGAFHVGGGSGFTDVLLSLYVTGRGQTFNREIEIIIPESFAGDIFITATSGNINARGCSFSGAVTLNSGSGNIDVVNTAFAANTFISSGSGFVTVVGHFDENTAITTGTGELRVYGSTFMGETFLSTGTGIVYASNSSFESAAFLTAGLGRISTSRNIYHDVVYVNT